MKLNISRTKNEIHKLVIDILQAGQQLHHQNSMFPTKILRFLTFNCVVGGLQNEFMSVLERFHQVKLGPGREIFTPSM